MEEVNKEFVISLFEQRYTFEDVSKVLQEMHPGVRGFSVRTLKRFCQKYEISPRISTEAVNTMVRDAVPEVGATYGRKMMTGYIRQKHGLNIGQNRIGASLARVFPNRHMQRRNNTARSTNPIPYRADYFGHKLHLDQNEKLVMYGVTHVIAVDGHSRFIVGGVTMPIKNNLLIYTELYRKALLEYGIFHQIRVDHGREFYLVLGMQEHLQSLRNNTEIISPYRQTQSKKNLPVERIWPEVNARVNYPIKRALVKFDNDQVIDMESDLQKFCVSYITCKIASVGLQRVISSWNEHPIAGRGVPSRIKNNSTRIQPLSAADVPGGNSAEEIYRQAYTGTLTDPHNFGFDPLSESEQLFVQRENELSRNFDFVAIFQEIVNSNSHATFKNAILFCVRRTENLSIHL